MRPAFKRTRRAALVALVLTLAACAPAKTPPPAEAAVTPPAQWRTAFPEGAEIDTQWWQLFQDPHLTALIEAALARNTDVLTAVSRVDEARQRIQLARSSLYPRLDASLGLQRSRELGTTGISRPRAIQPELQVSYELDVWGRLRDLASAASLQFEASEAERDTVRLAVASTMARSYMSLISLDRQLLVTRRTAESRKEALRIAQDRAELGYTSELELTQAQSEYEAAAQLIPELLRSIGQQENAIRVLAGDLPGGVVRARPEADIVLAPVPRALPSELLRRRPDMRQAEAQLAATDLNLDAERARFLPQVQISASIGGLFVNALNYDPVKIWSLGGSVLAPLFNGGQLRASVNVASAQRDQAAYAYRASALNAFAEVEDALSGVAQLGAQIERATARRDILLRSLEIARDRYRGGYSSYLEELDAQRNLFNIELAAIQIKESQINVSIDLYQALGGGWRPDAGSSEATTGAADAQDR